MHMIIPSLHGDDRKALFPSLKHTSSYITLRTSVNEKVTNISGHRKLQHWPELIVIQCFLVPEQVIPQSHENQRELLSVGETESC